MARKLLNEELGRLSPKEFQEKEKRPIVLVLDNVRSQHNIGAAYRTADAFGIKEVVLCGICATPPSADIHKSALGAELTMPWRHFGSTLEAAQTLREEGYQLVAIEQVEDAVMLNRFAVDFGVKLALFFGNEVKGVAQEVVDMCDTCLEIPQEGTKHSLNVSVSIGVVLWELCR